MPTFELRPLPPERLAGLEVVVYVQVQPLNRIDSRDRILAFRHTEVRADQLPAKREALLEMVGRQLDTLLGRDLPALLDPAFYRRETSD